jgi:hypothetical protein
MAQRRISLLMSERFECGRVDAETMCGCSSWGIYPGVSVKPHTAE